MAVEMHSGFGWSTVFVAAHENEEASVEAEIEEARRLHRTFGKPYRVRRNRNMPEEHVPFEIGTEHLEEPW